MFFSENHLQSMFQIFHCYMGFYQTCSFVYLSKTQLQGDLWIGISFLLPSFFNGANDVCSGEGYPNHSTNRKKKKRKDLGGSNGHISVVFPCGLVLDPFFHLSKMSFQRFPLNTVFWVKILVQKSRFCKTPDKK